MMRKHKYIRAFTRLFYAYPALMLVSLYVTWFAAWAVLGYQPRPSLDDPKYISTLVDIPYIVTMVLLIGAPGAMIMGVCLTPLHVRTHTQSRVALAAKTTIALVCLAVIWCTTVAIFRLDSWNVGMWFMD